MFSDYSQRMHRRLGFRPLEVGEPAETTVTYLGRAL
jgi:hypothetical protein